MTPRALLVADCGRGVGLGHLERMLALADALHPDVEVFVVVPERDLELRSRVHDRGHATVEAAGDTRKRAETAIGAAPSVGAIVLDGYVFDVALQGRLRVRAPLTVVDDLGLPADCDLAINPSPGGEALRPAGASAFLGGALYALIRASFLQAREAAPLGNRDPLSVLVSTGATDLAGIGERVSRELRDRDSSIEVVRVVGPDTRATMLDANPQEHLLVAPRDLSAALASARVYVGAAGTTAVQAACVGTPAVITSAVANQQAQAAALAGAGCAIIADASDLATTCLALLDDPARCEDMARRGRALVDGFGAGRVADAIRHLVTARTAS